MAELTEDEVFDLLDLMMARRYDADAMDFLAAYSDGMAEELFPGCHDLVILADALDSIDL